MSIKPDAWTEKGLSVKPLLPPTFDRAQPVCWTAQWKDIVLFMFK
jgi:hypothetical protein